MKKYKLLKLPIPILIAIAIVLVCGSGALIYALTKTTEKAGPVGYWKLDEGSGYTAYDASGNANNGTLTNFDFDDDSNWETGKVAGALEFDGSNDYVKVLDSASLDITGDFTLETWVKVDAINIFYGLISKWTHGATGNSYQIIVHDSNYIQLRVSKDGTTAGATYLDTSGIFTVTTNTWYHIVGVYDYVADGNSIMKIYVNGVEKNSTSTAVGPVFVTTTDVHIGDYSVVGIGPTNGLIDEVRVYNRVLTAAEVAWNYNRGGPVGWWKFDEGSGASAKDSSGNEHNGTITAATWATGKINGALSFDGSGDIIDTNNNIGIPGSSEFSMGLWFKWTEDNVYKILAGITSGASIYTGFYTNETTDKVIFVGDASFALSSNNTLKDGVWHHILVTYNSSRNPKNLMFVDGIQQTDTNNTAQSGSGDFTIGATKNGSFSFNGLIDDVRIYNYARSAGEIKMDYNFGFAAKFGGSYDLSRGLVGYWAFEEGSGYTAKDSTLNANNGTLTNFDFTSTSNWTTGNTAAGIGGALSFDGVDDYVAVADNASLNFGTGDFSFGVWIKIPSSGITTARGILGKYKTNGATTGYYSHIRGDNAGKFRANLIEGGDTYYVEGSTDLRDGQWHYLVAVFDRDVANNCKVYVDGADNTQTRSGTLANIDSITNTNPLSIGRNSEAAFTYTLGLIDDVRIYNRALSADEIRYLYNRRGPVGWWKFDEGSGTSAKDSSINSNIGTLASGAAQPTWTTGKINGALSFDGGDYVNFGNASSANFGTSNFTVEFWMNSSNNPSWGVIMGKYQDDNNRWYITTDAGGNLYSFFRTTGGEKISLYSSRNVEDSIWHQVALVVQKGVRADFYLDGLLLPCTNTGAAADSYDNTGDLHIGNYGSTNYSIGTFDDFRIYNYARSAGEIKMDYNFGFAAKFGGSYDLSRGLVGYWAFEEGNGYTAKDSTLNANNGTLTNFDFNDSSNWTTGNTAAGMGGALKFDGTNDYVKVLDANSLDLTVDFTMSAWIKVDSFSGNRNIIAKSAGGSDTTNYFFYIEGANSRLRQWIGSSSGNTIDYYSGTFTAGVWHYVVSTYENSLALADRGKFYIDGVATTVGYAQVGTFVSPLANNINVNIGSYGDGIGQFFNGLIDDVRVYNRALSVDEIRYLYNRRQPIGHWKFDEGAGTSAYDSSINANTGTFGAGAAAPTWTDGKIGRALSFDGGDYVNAGNGASLQNYTAKTVLFWMKAPTFTGSPRYIYDDGYWSSPYGDIMYLSTGSNSGTFYLKNTAGSTQSVGFNFTPDVWTMAGYSWNGSTVTTYLNGKPIGSPAAFSGTLGCSANSLMIGIRQSDLGAGFNGLIDDFRIYNYARTAAEIKADYNAGMSTYFK